MHWLDRLAAAVIRRPSIYPRLFPDGWGDLVRLDHLVKRIREPVISRESITPTFDGTLHEGHPIGFFASPCDVLHVSSSSTRQVVLFAASNDHTFTARLELANYLAMADIGSVLLEQAFYGERRAHAGRQPVRTVVDFLEMTIAAPTEGLGLIRWIAESGATPGISGFSMGGSHAAVVGALSRTPLAVAPMAASYSSSPVFTEGVLADSVDWPALGGRETALPRLQELLLALNIANLPAPPPTASAVFGIAREDGYVPERYSSPIIEHWPGAESVYVAPGHAGFHLWGKRVQAQLIVRAFDRFERSRLV